MSEACSVVQVHISFENVRIKSIQEIILRILFVTNEYHEIFQR